LASRSRLLDEVAKRKGDSREHEGSLCSPEHTSAKTKNSSYEEQERYSQLLFDLLQTVCEREQNSPAAITKSSRGLDWELTVE